MNYTLLLICAVAATALALVAGTMPYAPAAIAVFAAVQLAKK